MNVQAPGPGSGREIDRAAAVLARGEPIVVLTGAGISTESGLPDFRSPGGLWAGVDPLEVASVSAFALAPGSSSHSIGRVWRIWPERVRIPRMHRCKSRLRQLCRSGRSNPADRS